MSSLHISCCGLRAVSFGRGLYSHTCWSPTSLICLWLCLYSCHCHNLLVCNVMLHAESHLFPIGTRQNLQTGTALAKHHISRQCANPAENGHSHWGFSQGTQSQNGCSLHCRRGARAGSRQDHTRGHAECLRGGSLQEGTAQVDRGQLDQLGKATGVVA